MGLADGSKAHSRAHVVAEVEEGAAERDAAAVEGDAVEGGGHGVLADAEVDETAGRVVGGLHARILDVGAGVAREVGAAAHEPGHDVAHGVDTRLAGLAGGDLLARLPRGQLGLPPVEPPALEAGLELGPVALPGVEGLLPRALEALAPRNGFAVHGQHIVGDPERLVRWQAEDLLGLAHFVLAQG